MEPRASAAGGVGAAWVAGAGTVGGGGRRWGDTWRRVSSLGGARACHVCAEVRRGYGEKVLSVGFKGLLHVSWEGFRRVTLPEFVEEVGDLSEELVGLLGSGHSDVQSLFERVWRF